MNWGCKNGVEKFHFLQPQFDYLGKPNKVVTYIFELVIEIFSTVCATIGIMTCNFLLLVI